MDFAAREGEDCTENCGRERNRGAVVASQIHSHVTQLNRNLS